MHINQFDQESLIIRLIFSQLTFLTALEKMKLTNEFNSLTELLSCDLLKLSVIVGRKLKSILWNPARLKHDALFDIRIMQTYNIGVIFYDLEDYPQKLREIHDPPYALFYRGDVAILKNNCVAMVGTRHPSMTSIKVAKTIAQDLTVAGLTIVSGLAYGIDTQSHFGSLLAQGNPHYGKTIAVLGSSVENITPASNKRLAQSILSSGGLIISEYQPSSSVFKYNFVQRNRIISALSMATIVIEAPRGSGALITADFALEHNRLLCFYKKKDEFPHKSPGTKDIQILLFETEGIKTPKASKHNQKRSVDDYIEEGAPTIESALEFLGLLYG